MSVELRLYVRLSRPISQLDNRRPHYRSELAHMILPHCNCRYYVEVEWSLVNKAQTQNASAGGRSLKITKTARLHIVSVIGAVDVTVYCVWVSCASVHITESQMCCCTKYANYKVTLTQAMNFPCQCTRIPSSNSNVTSTRSISEFNQLSM